MRFVVQSPTINLHHLMHLHQLCHADQGQQFMQVAEHAYYLPGQQVPSPEALAFCAEQNLDCAFVTDRQTWSTIRLVVMDMDSTLINIECIDEIADMCGLKPEVAAITELSMRGEIDFTQSLRSRVALLKDLDESALQRVVDERLRLNPGAQALIDYCRQHGIKTMLVSGGFDFFANYVRAMLGLDYAHANTLEITNGKLTGKLLGSIVDAQAKADYLVKAREQLGLAVDQVIAIGDGANDLKMMAVAAAGVAYHAKPIVQQQATYALNHTGLDGVLNLFTTGH
ncbi:MAG: phosphoserine phosphatase SerB [Pseudomonadota bacterium]